MTGSRDIERHLEPELTGEDVAVDRIQVLRPLLPDADRLLPYLRRIDASRTYTNWGPLASELEARLAAHFGLPDLCVTSASSGTGALVGAILSTADKASAERPLAIVPALTFVATALSAEQCGFRTHLVDVDADSWRLQPETLYQHPLLEQGGLVVPVAPFGRAVPQTPWVEFRERTGVAVVIDGGASFEAISADPTRYLGEIPVALSFHATKSFATAEGGCVITADSRSSADIHQALNFGLFATRDCRAASTNGKMSEYHAAVGLAELDGWAVKHERLRTVANSYRQMLGVVGLSDRVWVAPDVASCYVLFRCAGDREANSVLRSLDASNVETRFWYGPGVHRQSYYADASRDSLPVTERIAPLAVGLPVALDLSEASIRRVVAALARGARGI